MIAIPQINAPRQLKTNAHAIFAAAANKFCESLNQIAAQMQTFFARFLDAVYSAACREYLEEFGRLPGSDRTARLRKKRRKIVMQWYLTKI